MAGDNEQSDKDILDGQLFGSQRTRSILLAFTVCLLVRIDHSRCIASLAGKHYATIPSSLLSPPSSHQPPRVHNPLGTGSVA